MKARILTVAGIVHLTVAVLLVLTFLLGQPVAVSGEMLGFTSTFTPPPPTDTPIPSGTPIPGAPTPAPSDPAGPAPHLSITKSASPTEVLSGGEVVFSIQVCNEGDTTAASVIVSDGLPSELVLAEASASQGVVSGG